MRLINGKLLLPFLSYIMIFIYYYTSITGYFKFDENDSIATKTLVVAILESLLLLTIILRRSRVNDRLLKSWLILIISILLVIYILSLYYKLPALSYYLFVALPLLVFLAINTVLDVINKRSILVYFTVMVMVLAVHYGILYSNALLLISQENLITNASYVILLFLPLMLCVDNKIIKYLFIMIVAIVLLSSNKRGGIVAFLLAVVAYIIINNRIAGRNNYRWFTLLATLAIVAASFYYITFISQNLTNEFLVNRFESIQDDEGSGRINVYLNAWNLIKSSDFGSLIVGHGYNAVYYNSALKASAHNDFLEVFYDYGIIVFVLYLSVIVKMFRRLGSMIKRKSRYTGQYACALSLFIVLSFVSHIVLYESLFSLFLIIFSCLIHFDKIDENENRNFSLPVSH